MLSKHGRDYSTKGRLKKHWPAPRGPAPRSLPRAIVNICYGWWNAKPFAVILVHMSNVTEILSRVEQGVVDVTSKTGVYFGQSDGLRR